MTSSRARAMCATTRKRIGIAALSGAKRVTRLARLHGTSRKFVRAPRERVRQAVDMAFAEPVAAPLAESFPRVSEAWVRRFVLAVTLIAHNSYRHVLELLRDLFGLSLSRTSSPCASVPCASISTHSWRISTPTWASPADKA